MPTPVGHVFGALILSTSQKQRLDTLSIVLVLFFALLPDIDFLFGFAVGDPNRYHHLFTHSFTFVVAAGMLGGYIWQTATKECALFVRAFCFCRYNSCDFRYFGAGSTSAVRLSSILAIF